MSLPTSFPLPHQLNRHDAPSLRWGVIGAGNIASHFVPAVQRYTDQVITAVAARSADRAARFAGAHGIESAYGSADELLAAPDVDVVYVAAPDAEHVPIGEAAVAAGKHVLIEKPLATSASDARRLTESARAAGVLVMEGMWARYLPQYDVIRQLVADGVLGELELFVGYACRALVPAEDRGSVEESAMSAVSGMGIYPLAVSSDFLGTPSQITARGIATRAGGDLTATVALGHPSGAIAAVTTSVVSRAPLTATLSGSRARVDLEESFFNPTSFTLATPEKVGQTMRWHDPTGIESYSGLCWQAVALARYAAEGRTESPLHTHAETISILETIDEARRQLTLAPTG